MWNKVATYGKIFSMTLKILIAVSTRKNKYLKDFLKSYAMTEANGESAVLGCLSATVATPRDRSPFSV